MNILAINTRYKDRSIFKICPMNKWKSLYIYFLSGTGNAKASAFWISDEAKKAGLRSVVQQIDRLENISMPEKG
jgi:hypothetical protein